MVNIECNRLFNQKARVKPFSRDEAVESVGRTLFEDARVAEQRQECEYR